MTKPIPILVTGAGSELAYGIIKACRRSSMPLRVIACDADLDALGLHWATSGYVVPRADREPQQYLLALKRIVTNHGVRAIFPTADPELDLLPHHRGEFESDLGCRIMVNNVTEMARFSDKWSAYRWYVEQGLPTPRTVRVDEAEQLDRFLKDTPFPVVIKPRRGGGSRSLYVARDADHVRQILPLVPDAIVQQHVGSESQEYTAGTFRSLQDEVFSIVLKRKLKFGMTYQAEVVQYADLHRFCERVIRKTNLQGVNNIQFRVTPEGPCIIEINPRFSGTTGIRAAFGFNEPEMFVREFVLNEAISAPIIRSGRVLRYMHEHYPPEDDGLDLPEDDGLAEDTALLCQKRTPVGTVQPAATVPAEPEPAAPNSHSTGATSELMR